MKKLLLAAPLAAACSTNAYLDSHAVLSGDLALTIDGKSHAFESGTLSLEAVAQGGARQAVLVAELVFAGMPVAFFTVTASASMTLEPLIVAPAERVVATYPEGTMMVHTELPLAASLVVPFGTTLVCDDPPAEGGLCGLKVAGGSLTVASSTLARVRLDGALAFDTAPTIERSSGGPD